MIRPHPAMLALLLLAAAPGHAQNAPQLGPAVNQALAGMAAAQAAIEALLRDPEAASRAGADAGVREAMALVQARAGALQQSALRLAPAPKGETDDPAASCRALNTKLLALGHDILHLYEQESFRSLLVRSYEPVLGLFRVELENLVQDHDDKLRELECLGEAKGGKP